MLLDGVNDFVGGIVLCFSSSSPRHGGFCALYLWSLVVV